MWPVAPAAVLALAVLLSAALVYPRGERLDAPGITLPTEEADREPNEPEAEPSAFN